MSELRSPQYSTPPAAVHSLAGTGLALLSGCLFAAAFPPLAIGPTAFVALVPLLAAVHHQPPRRALFYGWLAGTMGCTPLVSPSIHAAALRYFADSPWIDLVFAVLAPQVYAAVYFALFACLISRRRVEDGPSRYIVAVAAAWVVAEYARGHVFHGCPWVLLAHSQHERLWLIQIADLGGTAAVAFVIVTVNAFLFAILLRWRGARHVALGPAAVFVALLVSAVVAYGHRQLDRWRQPAAAAVTVVAVQGNISAAWRKSPAGNARALKELEELTLRGAPESPDLVVWPENAVGFAVTGNEVHFGRTVSALPETARLLLGAPRTVTDAHGQVRFRNSALLLERGGIVETYDKIRLTPYAEYSPFDAIPLLRSRFASAAPYEPGTEAGLFEVGGHRFATMICFEAIYPDLARQFVRAGATFLVNISNDDWFGDHAAVRQHFIASIFRSVETRRPLVRSTNSGVTAAVDATGAVIAMAPPNRQATLSAQIAPSMEITFYTRYGEVFTGLCALLVVVLLASRRRG